MFFFQFLSEVSGFGSISEIIPQIEKLLLEIQFLFFNRHVILAPCVKMREERENWPRNKKLQRLLHRQKDPRREGPLKSLDGSLKDPRDVSCKAPC